MISFNVYKRHVPLSTIITDSWACSLTREQAVLEASNAGYARCVVEPMIDGAWGHLDDTMNEALANDPWDLVEEIVALV